MSSHCANEPPVTVLIQYKDGKKEEVISASVPITVEVRKKSGLQTEDPDPNTPTGGCCDVAYEVKLTYQYCALGSEPNTCSGETITAPPVELDVVGKILGTRVTQFQGTDNAIELTRRGCDGIEQKLNLIGLSSQKLVSYSIQSIARADGKPDICDPPDPEAGKCEIIIKSSNGSLIYTKTDDCPIKYKVRCGDQCAEGEIRCESNSYPGYCCTDCADLARSLRR